MYSLNYLSIVSILTLLFSCGAPPPETADAQAEPLTCSVPDGTYRAQLTRTAVVSGPSSPYCPATAVVTLVFLGGDLQPSQGPFGYLNEPSTTRTGCHVEATTVAVGCGLRPGMCRDYGEVYQLDGLRGTVRRTFAGNSADSCQADYNVELQ